MAISRGEIFRSAGRKGRRAQGLLAPRTSRIDDASRKLLVAVRAMAVRIGELQDAAELEDETAKALAREMVSPRQAVEDARNALTKAAELAAR